ncbi:MAG: hypothetical protein ACHQW9_00070 [Nitrososphaerales archaeon]
MQNTEVKVSLLQLKNKNIHFRVWWLGAGLTIFLIIGGVISYYDSIELKTIYGQTMFPDRLTHFIGNLLVNSSSLAWKLVFVGAGLFSLLTLLAFFHTDECKVTWRD